MRRILMVCYYYPPMGGVGSIRAAAFARQLPSLGWEPAVLAPLRGAYHQDDSLRVDERRVLRTASLEPSRVAKAVMKQPSEDGVALQLGPTGSRFRNALRRWIYSPDGQIGWYPFAVTHGRRLLASTRFDAIFSSSFPITAHLVARRLGSVTE